MTQNGATFCRTIGKCHHFNPLNNLNQHKFRAHFMFGSDFGLRTQCGIYGEVSITSHFNGKPCVECFILVNLDASIDFTYTINSSLSIEVQQHREQKKRREKHAENNMKFVTKVSMHQEMCKYVLSSEKDEKNK